nr:hypothetical protein BaRGS_019857 [Batillaria attramentaria]
MDSLVNPDFLDLTDVLEIPDHLDKMACLDCLAPRVTQDCPAFLVIAECLVRTDCPDCLEPRESLDWMVYLVNPDKMGEKGEPGRPGYLDLTVCLA